MFSEVNDFSLLGGTSSILGTFWAGPVKKTHPVECSKAQMHLVFCSFRCNLLFRPPCTEMCTIYAKFAKDASTQALCSMLLQVKWCILKDISVPFSLHFAIAVKPNAFLCSQNYALHHAVQYIVHYAVQCIWSCILHYTVRSCTLHYAAAMQLYFALCSCSCTLHYAVLTSCRCNSLFNQSKLNTRFLLLQA